MSNELGKFPEEYPVHKATEKDVFNVEPGFEIPLNNTRADAFFDEKKPPEHVWEREKDFSLLTYYLKKGFPFKAFEESKNIHALNASSPENWQADFDAYLHSSEFLEGARKGILFCFENFPDSEMISSALKIKDTFSLPEEICQQAAEEGMASEIKGKGYIGMARAVLIGKAFHVPEEVFQRVGQDAFLRDLENGYPQGALDLRDRKEMFFIPDAFFASSEAEEAAGKGILLCMKDPKLTWAVAKLENNFPLPKDIRERLANEGIFPAGPMET